MIILASGSPRRQALLQQIGVRFRQQVADVDETPLDNESAQDYVVRLAVAKACAVRQQSGADKAPVLGADTAVVVDGRLLGKPADLAHARDMLQLLSGRRHQVLSAVALVQDRQAVAASASSVWFRALSEKDIEDYWKTGEPRDKAGAYGIQGIGAIFIERLEGSYSGVMGLPLYETAQLLQDFGIQVLDHDS
ncbi:MAG: Maf family protein [Pseudomonadota bacterium]|nr:Maf family protein [Pseudomonadota bacterium]